MLPNWDVQDAVYPVGTERWGSLGLVVISEVCVVCLLVLYLGSIQALYTDDL